MKKIAAAGIACFLGAVLFSSCQKRQYVCTCTLNLVETEHMTGVYRSKKDAKNWCDNYEKPIDGTSCEISN